MHGILDKYFSAVFAHDLSKAPLAPDARATENAAKLDNGSGIWRSASGYGDVQRRYFDTRAGQAAYYGVIKEGGDPAIVSLRLKIENRKVTEAEWTIARKNDGGMFSIADLAALPPPPDTPIPKSDRTSRADLISAANAYFDGIQLHDGSHVPHIDGCERVDNGVKVTNRIKTTDSMSALPSVAPTAAGAPTAAEETVTAPSRPTAVVLGRAQEARSGDCASDFERFARTISETSHRRFPVVDEEAGVVMGATLFHRPPGVMLKRNVLTEFFWERQGKISAIYAAMFYLDPNAPDSPGWN
jgi:hypothetical protein